MLSSSQANKIAKSAVGLLKLSVGYRLSKSLLSIIEQILQKNGVKPEPMKGGRKQMIKRYVAGKKPEEVKMLEGAALKLLKVAIAYDLSKSILEELKKLVENEKQ